MTFPPLIANFPQTSNILKPVGAETLDYSHPGARLGLCVEKYYFAKALCAGLWLTILSFRTISLMWAFANMSVGHPQPIFGSLCRPKTP